jgi:hypothetical protein
MARLSINWRSMNKVAPDTVTTGETAEQAAEKARTADKPMMVYIASDEATDSDTRKLEDVVFANEKFAIGTKFFDTIKVTQGHALSDRVLKETGDATPRIVFLTRDFKVEDTLSGSQLSAGKLLKAMGGIAKKEYVNNFDKMTRDYTKLLNELDRLEGKRAKLVADRARLQDKPSPTKEKKIQREEDELQKEMQEWQEAENALLAFRLEDASTEA